MSIFKNIYIPYMCDPLDLYISLGNNSMDPINFSTFINCVHQYIYKLIKDQFNPIDRLSCQPVGCQAIRCALGDIEYIRTTI